MATVLTQIGTFVGGKTKETRNLAVSEAEAATTAAVTQLRGGVAQAGDTLAKLYALIAGNRTTHTVANITARDALVDLAVGDHVFVEDDGDSGWALYMVTAIGPSDFVKVSDPDTLGEQLSAAQIKSLYEQNMDTNAFTDTQANFLNALSTGLASLSTTAKASYVAAINEVLGIANSAASAASDAQDDADTLDGRLQLVETAQTNLGTFSDFETAFDAALS